MNWLELGFVSDSLADLLDYLPFERSNLRPIIKNVPNERLYNPTEIQKIDDLIYIELSSDLKDQWLFRLGRQLKTIQNSCWSGCNDSMVKLSNLIDQAPSGISTDLLTRLRQLVSDNNPEMVGSRIQFLKDRLFDLEISLREQTGGLFHENAGSFVSPLWLVLLVSLFFRILYAFGLARCSARVA